MITNLKTKNFMGKNINEPISQKMIYYGENTSGKSTRAIAICICVLGFAPFSAKPAKKAGDILNDFGDGEFMSIEITCGNHTLERSFSKSKTESVSHGFKFDGRKRSKSAFEIELYKSGVPNIVDVNSFIKSSDTDRINTLFSIYPPGNDVGVIDSSIDTVKKKISGLSEKITSADSTIKALIKNKDEIQMPAGSLAETQEEIKKLTDEILTAQKELKAEEIKIAEAAATKKAEENAKEKSKNIKNIVEKNDNSDVKNQEVQSDHVDVDYKRYNLTINKNTRYPMAFKIDGPENNPAISIQKIINAMKESECTMCAAMMLAKFELGKY